MEQLSKKSATKKFQRVLAELGSYSYFSSEIIDSKLHLKGKLEVGYGDADSFNIEIIVSEDFPKKIALVYELDGRIPVVLDRHFMTDGNGCCLVMPHQYRQIYNGSTPFSDFIDRLIIPFFQNQIHYEITGEFVMGYSHGHYGMSEFYEETFGKTDTLTLIRLIGCVLNQKVAGHRQCPCESGKRQRHCHGPGLIQLAKFGDIGHLQDEYKRCRTILEKAQNYRSAIDDHLHSKRPPDYISISASMAGRLEYFSKPRIQVTPETLEGLLDE